MNQPAVGLFRVKEKEGSDSQTLLFDIGFFEPLRAPPPPPPHHDFVVIAPMIMKFGTSIKLDVFYTIVAKKFVTSVLLRNYDVITYILDDHRHKFQMPITPKLPD